MKHQWVVWTERARENPRKGHGQAELERTLCHLADRGDLRCRLQAEHDDSSGDNWPSIVAVDLAEHRTSP